MFCTGAALRYSSVLLDRVLELLLADLQVPHVSALGHSDACKASSCLTAFLALEVALLVVIRDESVVSGRWN